MKKNYYNTVEVKFMKSKYFFVDYRQDIPTWKSNYNNHHVKYNPKEIDSIEITDKNTLIIGFWSEKKLPSGREVQSLRRFSQEMAKTNQDFVLGKSHVLRAA